VITGYREAIQVYNDPRRSVTCTAVTGPSQGFLFRSTRGDDVTELISIFFLFGSHSHELPLFDQLRRSISRPP